jgi:hypothetical protein
MSINSGEAYLRKNSLYPMVQEISNFLEMYNEFGRIDEDEAIDVIRTFQIMKSKTYDKLITLLDKDLKYWENDTTHL